MRLPPPEVLLSWPSPNYTDPETRGPGLLIVNYIFISLVILSVSARLYTRIWIKHWFGIDDVFIILATIFSIGVTAIVILANKKYGWDRHVYDIPPENFGPNLKIAFAAKLLFTAAATFTRLALLTFYYRLVKDSDKQGFRWIVHLNLFYTIANFITFSLLVVFLCVPVHYYWMFGAPSSACLDEATIALCAGIINVIADFACTVTPIPLVMALSMPRKQRMAVIFLFSLGFLVTIVGCVRTWYIYKSLVSEWDHTWYAYPLWIASTIEIDLGVICASAPVLRPLISSICSSFSSAVASAPSAKTTLATSSRRDSKRLKVLTSSERASRSSYQMLPSRTWSVHRMSDGARDRDLGISGGGDGCGED